MNKILRTSWQFFVYSNLYIVLVAGLMTTEVYSLVLLQTPDLHFILFVGFSTLSSYSLHWYFPGPSRIITPRTSWLKKNRHIHGILLLVGLAGTAWTLTYFMDSLQWIGLSAIATFLYTAPKLPLPGLVKLRRTAYGKTVFLAAVWTYVTVLLPVLVSRHEWTPELISFCISKYLLIFIICILFDYRDRDDDTAAGIRSLITYLSPAGIQRLFLFSFILFCITTVTAGYMHFSYYSMGALLAPGIICLLLYKKATRNFSDNLYYVILDGLMAFSAVLHLFTVI